MDERTFQRRAVQREYRRRYKTEVATNAAVAVSEKEVSTIKCYAV